MPTTPTDIHTGWEIISQWMLQKGLQPFAYQREVWQKIVAGKSGIVHAPTGFGKTYSVFLGSIIQFINNHPNTWKSKNNNGLVLLWISPLRALAKDIARAMEAVILELGMPWKIAIRNGDTPTAERERQKKQVPEILIITPESLHLLLATKHHEKIFDTLSVLAVDEWHELQGSKRGVQTELAIAYIQFLIKKTNRPLGLQVWGISATIGNLTEALEVLLPQEKNASIVTANLQKKITVHTLFPDEIEKFPWAGHLGLQLADKVVEVIEQNNTTLVFINTRGMSENWFQKILDSAPHLAGAFALHHGSIEPELRNWVEDALHTQRLKAVVATASLDLGVDFRPVDAVVQVGSPKGVSRFLQRAGRAGHHPDAVSHIYFLPTHSLELMEAAALKQAIAAQEMESRPVLSLCFDVLCQFLCTLAVGNGFLPEEIFRVVKATNCFSEISFDDWQACLLYITAGGQALHQYDDFRKVDILDNGYYVIRHRKIAMRHRQNIGTIVSDAMMKVKLIRGGFLGHLEEWFIARLKEGDVFTIAGQTVALVQIKEMTALVQKTSSKKSIVPSWGGGRMSLSSNLGRVLRETFEKAAIFTQNPLAGLNILPATVLPELQALLPLLTLQAEVSHIPRAHELLIEQFETKEGYHLVVYPFEGRQLHEAMSAIIAFRLSRRLPISFSIAMNDYGFELLSDQPIPIDDTNVHDLFSSQELFQDMQRSINHVEMAQRKFRDIAVIGGLIFQGLPGEYKKPRHLQASASLIFQVFKDFDPNNLLYRQAYAEVFEQQMEEHRLRQAFERISTQTIVLKFPTKPTPFSFPIVADGLNRNNLSSEQLHARIMQLNKDARPT